MPAQTKSSKKFGIELLNLFINRWASKYQVKFSVVVENQKYKVFFENENTITLFELTFFPIPESVHEVHQMGNYAREWKIIDE